MAYNKADHDNFLLKKKQEIMAGKQNTVPKVAPTIVTTQSANVPKIPFANDGSFLARFQEMQRKQTEDKTRSDVVVKEEGICICIYIAQAHICRPVQAALFFLKYLQLGSLPVFLKKPVVF